jgi:streptogramin lyase
VASTVWGISSVNSSIDRIDPKTRDVQAKFKIPGFASDDSLYNAVLDNAIWIKGYQSGALVKFDPATQEFTQYEIPGYGRPSGYYDEAPVAALGSLWLRISDTSVVRVDPADGKVVATYPAGPGGGAVAVDFGSLWVANFNTDTVWRERINP